MGYSLGALRYTRESEFGLVADRFALDDVYCDGSETSLFDCRFDVVDNCGPDEGAGVVCRPEPTGDDAGSITLVGGNSANEGNIIVRRPMSDLSGPLCDDSYRLNAMDVVSKVQHTMQFFKRIKETKKNCNNVQKITLHFLIGERRLSSTRLHVGGAPHHEVVSLRPRQRHSLYGQRAMRGE